MLIGTSTTLRAWTVNDAPNIQKLKNDVDIQTQLMGVPKPNSINKILNWLNSRDKDESMVFLLLLEAQMMRLSVIFNYPILINLINSDI